MRILKELEPYMFTLKNIETFSSLNIKPASATMPSATRSSLFKQKSVAAYLQQEEKEEEKEKEKEKEEKKEKEKEKEEKKIIKREEMIPRHRDKLFWCFYIIYKGEHEYEQHLTDNFITEKNFKIAAAEKFKEIKDKFKQAKLKISEMEDEMINQPKITLKGLHALCLLYGVSIVYEDNQKYCEFLYNVDNEEEVEIICLKEKNGNYAIKCFEKYDTAGNEEAKKKYIQHIRETYWQIENIEKGLKAPSAYTLKELQTIAEKFSILLKNTDNKNKTKQVLYEELLTKM
jgi:hypothetical protein